MAGNTKRETQGAGILHELADIKAEVQRMEATGDQIANGDEKSPISCVSSLQLICRVYSSSNSISRYLSTG